MLQLLFSVIFCQMALILLLMFKTPLRKLVIFSLDRVKRGRGPLVVKSVAATVFVIMMYNIYSVQEIYSRPLESFNPTDQVLLAHQILQASFMGKLAYSSIPLYLIVFFFFPNFFLNFFYMIIYGFLVLLV